MDKWEHTNPVVKGVIIGVVLGGLLALCCGIAQLTGFPVIG